MFRGRQVAPDEAPLADVAALDRKPRQMAAALGAADAYMKAWSERNWISEPSAMPPPPHSLDDMYLVHKAMQDHVLAAELGGLCGYKLGAVGVIAGESAISAPLFQKFCVDSPSGVVSAASIQAHNLEAEVGVIIQVVRRIWLFCSFAFKPRALTNAFPRQQDLGPKPDGTNYILSEVWAAVECVMPVIEICGRRSSAECLATQVESALCAIQRHSYAARVVCWACAGQGLAAAASRKVCRCPKSSRLNPML